MCLELKRTRNGYLGDKQGSIARIAALLESPRNLAASLRPKYKGRFLAAHRI